jgi:L-ascorbate metabolism protein UlaG (beta-lactamase superfamily)
VLVTVINPFGNMDPGQAARLARDLGVKIAIPGHYDLFPDNTITPKYLRMNLMVLDRGGIYRELERGKVYVYPETTSGRLA